MRRPVQSISRRAVRVFRFPGLVPGTEERLCKISVRSAVLVRFKSLILANAVLYLLDPLLTQNW